MNIESQMRRGLDISESPFEVVELKGRGHPDTICDLLCESISNDILNLYTEKCGRPLHYNIDKALLVGGRSKPQFKGGEIIEPVRLYLGDRAIEIFNGQSLGLSEVVNTSIKNWLDKNLRFLRLGSNLVLHNEIKNGSENLNSVEDRKVSNDTSVGVGSWPPTQLEVLVIDIEKYLNSSEAKLKFPEIGEDIKIMAIRHHNEVEVICAIAMVDRYISSVEDYMSKKTAIANDIKLFIASKNSNFKFEIKINCLDKPESGIDGLYLTVTGLSCESGDSGQVGRGNRVNQLISFLRPQTMEAWAGKNPITHVGKIYSFAAQNLAKKLCEASPEIRQANVFLVGKIGNSVRDPAYVFSDIILSEKTKTLPSKEFISECINQEIKKAEIFHINYIRGNYA